MTLKQVSKKDYNWRFTFCINNDLGIGNVFLFYYVSKGVFLKLLA